MRKAYIRISPELVTRVFTEMNETKSARCVKGLPTGAEILGASVDFTGDLCVSFTHESFEDLPEGAVPVLIMPVFETVNN